MRSSRSQGDKATTELRRVKRKSEEKLAEGINEGQQVVLQKIFENSNLVLTVHFGALKLKQNGRNISQTSIAHFSC